MKYKIIFGILFILVLISACTQIGLEKEFSCEDLLEKEIIITDRLVHRKEVNFFPMMGNTRSFNEYFELDYNGCPILVSKYSRTSTPDGVVLTESNNTNNIFWGDEVKVSGLVSIRETHNNETYYVIFNPNYELVKRYNDTSVCFLDGVNTNYCLWRLNNEKFHDIENCHQITQGDYPYKNMCYRDLAIKESNLEYCAFIEDEEFRSSCINNV